jgi:hypothetical protein
MLDRFCGVAAEDMAWSFAAEHVEDWFVTAGITRLAVEQVNRTIELPFLVEFVPAHMKATPWASRFDELSTDERSEAIAYMENRLVDFRTSTGLDTPFGSHLATATT